MPQTQTPTKNQTDDNYTAVDPQKDPVAFIYQHRGRLRNMEPEKAIKFLDMVFQRIVLPKYQSINKQRPLDPEEADKIRLQFSARMLNLPFEPTELKGDKKEYGTGAKALASVEGAGAGVLGGIKTIAELSDKLDKWGTKVDPRSSLSGTKSGSSGLSSIGKVAGKQEAKSYEDASLVSPKGASAGAAVGHQIPAMIATGGVEGALPTAAKGAGVVAKMATGGARGAAGGATYEAARPGGDPKQGAMWGGVLGGAFPLLGKMFGLGRKVAEPVADAAVPSSAPAASAPAANMGDIANTVSKNKFGKSFKDLTPTEKTQLPAAMKEEIQKQAAQKQATAKATKAAAKAEKEVEEATKRAEKARVATEKAQQQATKRSGTDVTISPESTKAQSVVPSSGIYQKQAIAAKAAEENPAAAKVMKMTSEGEDEMERARRGATTKEISKTPEQIAGDEQRRLAKEAEAKKTAEVQKVPAGQTGPKVRAKEGQPASPAQQAADRERIAKQRELSKGEEFGKALEKHAQEMAGRHTSTSIGIMHVPELEGAVKEMPEGEYMLKTLQKAKRAYKWSDEIYAESLKEWLLNQFGAK